MEYEQKKKSTGFLPYVIIALGTILISTLGVFLICNFCTTRNVSRTVMIYMVGADLESENGLASEELGALKNPQKILDNGINVLLIAGGSKEWDNDYISADETSIFHLTEKGFKKVKTQKVLNMGDPKVLTDFINYSTTNFPSDDYDLILWNHGGAIDGSEYDELHNNDNLSISEIKEGLSGSIFGDEKKLEAVIFSTCLNGSLEMANMLSEFSRYFVASEEVSVSFADSSDFSFLEDVSQFDDGDTLGEKFVERYQEKAASLKKLYRAYSQKYDIYSTYSVVDLSKIEKVTSAMNEFFGSIDAMENYSDISKIRSGLYQYANDQARQPDYDMVDLYNLALSLDDLSSKSAKTVTDAIEEAVVYNFATNSESRGLSIYFPYNGDSSVQKYFLKIYPDITPSESYTEFISNFNQVLVAGTGSSKLKGIDLKNAKVDNVTSETADFSVELTEEQAATFTHGRYMVVRSNPDYPGYYWPTYFGNSVELDGTTLKANVHGRQLMARDAETGQSHTITVMESEETDDYIKYEFAVVLQDLRPDDIKDWRIDAATIHITRDKQTNEIGISDAYILPKDDDSDTFKMKTPIYVSYEDYQYISFISSSYNIMNDDLSVNPDYESNGIIQGWENETDDLELVLQENFDDGYEYYCMFRVWDIYNNESITNFVKLK